MTENGRVLEGATVQLRFTNGQVLDLELGLPNGPLVTAALSVVAEIRQKPSGEPWIEYEATGLRTADLVLKGPILRSEVTDTTPHGTPLTCGS